MQNRPHNNNKCAGGGCSGALGPSSDLKPGGLQAALPKTASKGAVAVMGREEDDGTPHLDVAGETLDLGSNACLVPRGN